MKTKRWITLLLSLLLCLALLTACGKTIGDAKAREIAFADAGVTANDIRDLDCELDREGGVTVYEIEFEVGFDEYSYIIDAKTGEILKSKVD